MDMTYSMRVFVKVVESGSFVRAADALDTSNAAVTRQIGALEAHLGVRLLHRTTRRMSLTDAGSGFYERSIAILDDIAAAEAQASRGSAEVVGSLRLSAPLSFGVSQLPRVLQGFREHYPELQLNVDLTDRVVDLAYEGIDVAIRIARELTGNLVARRIAAIKLVACASPDYLRRRGAPRSPADLARHTTLQYSYLASGDAWVFSGRRGKILRVRVRPDVYANNGDLLGDLAVAGAGIVLQPTFIVGRHLARGALVPILSDYPIPPLNLYAVYLSRQHQPLKVRAFVDHLIGCVADPPPWDPKPRARSAASSATWPRDRISSTRL